MTILAIVDLSLGHSAVLISLLAAGPVVAAARAGPRSTALVGDGDPRDDVAILVLRLAER